MLRLDALLKPSLLYLPDSYKTKDDSTVYTSGKDGILPSGIPVGNIFKEDNEFLVELFSNPSQLSFVNTILQNPKNMKEF